MEDEPKDFVVIVKDRFSTLVLKLLAMYLEYYLYYLCSNSRVLRNKLIACLQLLIFWLTIRVHKGLRVRYQHTHLHVL